MSQKRVIDIWFIEQEERNDMFRKGLFITLVFVLMVIWIPLPEFKITVPTISEPKTIPTITIKWPDPEPTTANKLTLITKEPKFPVPAEFLKMETAVIVQHQEIDMVDPSLDTVTWESDLSMASMAPESATKALTLNTPGLEGPVFTRRVPPHYPKVALRNGLQGYVILEATLTSDGKIEEVQVIKNLGEGKFGFEDAAAKALQMWRFLPGHLNGKPVNVRLVLRIDFKLK